MKQINYTDWKQAYKYSVKTWPDVTAMYGNDARIIVTERETRQTRTGSRWTTESEEERRRPLTEYMNIIDAVPFFRNIGGTETVTTNYTRWGKIPTKIISTSPDKETRVIREFTF